VRYQVEGYTIRSENAAKPAAQTSKYVVQLLEGLSPMSRALDYGCGKLRYAIHVIKLAKRLTLVDSECQLSRTQLIEGKNTTIREYVEANWPQARVFNDREFRGVDARYDFILCANVLSAIPLVRTRTAVARLLAQRLTARGRCLFICQYTNSYFCGQMADRSVKKFADGFIKGRPDNASFYGLIKPDQLRKLVSQAGLSIDKAWINDQSGYVIANRK
jgi:2-polyprenyl-3-methyl-5-hydroxy-6-metoxy-1,4-benzoquinol methylase